MESNVKILEGIVLIYFFVHTSKKALSTFPPPSLIVIWSLNYPSNDPNTHKKRVSIDTMSRLAKAKIKHQVIYPVVAWGYQVQIDLIYQ